MDLLKGKVAIVSGIGPGVGKEVAYAFAREGADVVLAARTASALEEVALGIQKRRQKSLCVPTDISKPEDCARLVEQALKTFKRVGMNLRLRVACQFLAISVHEILDQAGYVLAALA